MQSITALFLLVAIHCAVAWSPLVSRSAVIATRAAAVTMQSSAGVEKKSTGRSTAKKPATKKVATSKAVKKPTGKTMTELKQMCASLEAANKECNAQRLQLTSEIDQLRQQMAQQAQQVEDLTKVLTGGKAVPTGRIAKKKVVQVAATAQQVGDARWKATDVLDDRKTFQANPMPVAATSTPGKRNLQAANAVTDVLNDRKTFQANPMQVAAISARVNAAMQARDHFTVTDKLDDRKTFQANPITVAATSSTVEEGWQAPDPFAVTDRLDDRKTFQGMPLSTNGFAKRKPLAKARGAGGAGKSVSCMTPATVGTTVPDSAKPITIG